MWGHRLVFTLTFHISYFTEVDFQQGVDTVVKDCVCRTEQSYFGDTTEWMSGGGHFCLSINQSTKTYENMHANVCLCGSKCSMALDILLDYSNPKSDHPNNHVCKRGYLGCQ